MICPNCGSKTPKEITVNDNAEVIYLNGYSVATTKPIFQCKNKSCNCVFNPLVATIRVRKDYKKMISWREKNK